MGSLEALITLLKQENIRVVKAGIGNINKSDIVSARTNIEIDPLNAVILGFNVLKEEDVQSGKMKIITGDVVYKLIENLQEWIKNKQKDIERGRMLSLDTIVKLEILPSYLFRNSNPAIFGVRVVGGKLKNGIELIVSHRSGETEEIGKTLLVLGCWPCSPGKSGPIPTTNN